MSSSNTSIPLFSSDVVQLEMLKRSIVIIFGLIILISGLWGNILNIIIFGNLSYYKENPCSLYIFARSIVDLFVLLIGLGTRVLGEGFQIDFTIKNDIWCRMRVPLIYINTLCSYTFLCFQSIDIYLITSKSISLRQKSHIKTARRLIYLTILIWIIEEIPYFFYQKLEFNSQDNQFRCLTKNFHYFQYRVYFIYLLLTTVFPVIIIVVFDLLTYRHLRIHFNENRPNSLSILTKQMTRMTLFHLISLFLFQAPFAVSQSYFLTRSITSNLIYEAQQRLIQQFFNVLGYGIYSVSEQNFFVFQSV